MKGASNQKKPVSFFISITRFLLVLILTFKRQILMYVNDLVLISKIRCFPIAVSVLLNDSILFFSFVFNFKHCFSFYDFDIDTDFFQISKRCSKLISNPDYNCHYFGFRRRYKVIPHVCGKRRRRYVYAHI